MRTESAWLETPDGIRMHVRAHEPDGAPGGVIAMIHGLGEHAGRYEHVARYFTARGYAFVCPDLRGHGKTAGKRGYAPSYDTMLADIDLVLGWTAKRHPGLPTCLYGHSMGGNLVLMRLFRGNLPAPIACAVAGSPWLSLHAPPGAATVAVARIASRLMPTFTAKNDLKVDDLTRSEAVRAATREDPDYHRYIGARLFEEVTVAGKTLLDGKRPEAPVPLFVMVGTNDLVVSHEAVLAFIDQCGGTCESKVWEDFYHELHNEPESEEVLGVVADFLTRRMPASAGA